MARTPWAVRFGKFEDGSRLNEKGLLELSGCSVMAAQMLACLILSPTPYKSVCSYQLATQRATTLGLDVGLAGPASLLQWFSHIKHYEMAETEAGFWSLGCPRQEFGVLGFLSNV